MCDIETLLNSMDIHVTKWKEYSKQSFNGNAIQEQLENLLNSSDRIVHQIKKFTKCPHNFFDNQQLFLDVLWGYMNNEKQSLMTVRQYNIETPESITNPIKTGFCMNCMQQFIIKTNGMKDIFINWQKNAKNEMKCRSEFHNTNIIMIKQPIFLKCILLPSNIQTLTQIFNLFFVSFLKNINLNSMVIRNVSGEDIPLRIWYLDQNIGILNTNINIMHGIEHSLSSLSTTINELIPLLKLYHIQHLFLNNPALTNIATTIDKFVAQYVQMPHLIQNQGVPKHVKKYKKFRSIENFNKWRKKMLTDELFAKQWKYRDSNGEPIFCIGKMDMTIDDTIELFLKDKHVILQRIMEIFAMLYKKFVHFYKKLKKRNVEKNRILIQQLRMQITIFEQLMYNKQYLNTMKATLKNVHKVTMNDHIWSLVASLLPIVNNKSRVIKHNNNIYCTVCHKRQKNEAVKFKLCCDCKITYYCGKKCQKYDWNRNKHKYVCKLLVAVL